MFSEDVSIKLEEEDDGDDDENEDDASEPSEPVCEVVRAIVVDADVCCAEMLFVIDVRVLDGVVAAGKVAELPSATVSPSLAIVVEVDSRDPS